MKEPLRIGKYELHWLAGGEFALDGGAMFGVVPKVLWARRYEADEQNRIRLLSSPILVKAPSFSALIDTGIGNKLNEKQKKIYKVTAEWDIERSLSAIGMSRGDIDYVILTHCDFDHAGGVAMIVGEGGTELTFPNARYVVQRQEWEDVMNPGRRESNTYLAVNFETLKAGTQLELVEGRVEVATGVIVERTGGHTRGHQVVWVESGASVAVHMGDLLPTHVHYNPLWVMAYDNFPLECIEKKAEIEKAGTSRSAWFTFYHDPFMNACRFDEGGNIVERYP